MKTSEPYELQFLSYHQFAAESSLPAGLYALPVHGSLRPFFIVDSITPCDEATTGSHILVFKHQHRFTPDRISVIADS
jgi:hypothetical protein